ncbi:hypothetical protein CCUS01_02516 [Colletotrichum cuscutae]|uniref:Uncharacterized protein n=1 Tax=Colletotrichum cuscutae TaxID=1209917 RepID=A0AAI9YDE0_9PEZI|nr:hypothetical protein CCUS01_02516 [Colletotrichum cuscutae]
MCMASTSISSESIDSIRPPPSYQKTNPTYPSPTHVLGRLNEILQAGNQSQIPSPMNRSDMRKLSLLPQG